LDVLAEELRRLQPADHRHRLGDIDVEELGDVRHRERRIDHGLGHHLRHTLERDPLLVFASVTRRGGRRRRRTRRRGGHLVGGTRTSSRVTSPWGPVATTWERSTPRSLASLRTGGFAKGLAAPPGTAAGSADPADPG